MYSQKHFQLHVCRKKKSNSYLFIRHLIARMTRTKTMKLEERDRDRYRDDKMKKEKINANKGTIPMQ